MGESMSFKNLLAGLTLAGVCLSAPLSATSESFSMIVSSDPQYPWTNCTDGDCDEDADTRIQRARQLNIDQRDAMTSLADTRGDVKGVIINGDLTAYGHPKELKVYKEIWLASPLKLYEGLGNHDYLNNIDDTWLNQAANGMIDYMVARLSGPLGVEADVSVANGLMSKTTTGSLSYSWDVGDIHFVQLHNFPTYERQWSTFVWTSMTQKTYVIENALDWLEADLVKAHAQGKKIILNMHDTGEHWLMADGGFAGANHADRLAMSERFSDLLRQFPVTAIFAGHYHKLIGPEGVWDGMPDYEGVPIFYSGSTSQSRFLLAEFGTDALSVQGYSSIGGLDTPVTEVWTVPFKASVSSN